MMNRRGEDDSEGRNYLVMAITTLLFLAIVFAVYFEVIPVFFGGSSNTESIMQSLKDLLIQKDSSTLTGTVTTTITLRSDDVLLVFKSGYDVTPTVSKYHFKAGTLQNCPAGSQLCVAIYNTKTKAVNEFQLINSGTDKATVTIGDNKYCKNGNYCQTSGTGLFLASITKDSSGANSVKFLINRGTSS